MKYHNKKMVVDGITFDSMREASYYVAYKNLERQGEIKNLQLQTPFNIEINGKKICKYLADFTYEDNSGFHIVDVKSPITAKDRVFRLKKKLVEAFYDVEIEIMY